MHPARHIDRSGFSLVELLLVVMILGIIAALVVPQFTNAGTMARESSLRDNLRRIRTQILVYQAQHNGMCPGYPHGDLGASPTAQAFLDQMTGHTDVTGAVSSVRTDQFEFGPYLAMMPANPFNQQMTVKVIGDNEAFPTEAQGDEGWVFQPATGKFVANTPGQDINGVAYIDY